MEVHVVSKINNDKHAAFPLDPRSLPKVELGSSSIRVQTVLISLTSNNLSYARGGHFLHWWETYPVPTTSPSPYNDSLSWGIVPAWGYARVVETTTSIPQGTVLWGFWPTSSIPTDLKVTAIEPKGQWTEVSSHRQVLMSIYNRYIEIPNFPTSLSSQRLEEGGLEQLAWDTLFRPIWQTGHLLSQHTFSASPEIHAPIHPLGVGATWTAADADLSSSILVSLSASSKTARCFAWHLSQRPAAGGPLGLLQVTSSPEPISKATDNLQMPFETISIAYSKILESITWMSGLKASKIVIVDFGARGNTLNQLLESINHHSTLKSLKVVIVHVGSEQKVYTNEELKATRDAMSRHGKIQFNTSAVRDAAIDLVGAETYFDSVGLLWDKWLRDRKQSIPDMQITWGRGVSGPSGVEGGWEELCQGRVGSEYGLVYEM